MWTVTKSFRFEAAHSLPHLPEGHKCRNLHGHSYKVVVHCYSRELDERGFVVDYADISAAMRPIVAMLDHKNLNDVIVDKTTAETLAWWIYMRLHESDTPNLRPFLCAVEVSETDSANVIYRP